MRPPTTREDWAGGVLMLLDVWALYLLVSFVADWLEGR